MSDSPASEPREERAASASVAPSAATSPWVRLRRGFERATDRLGLRPLTVLVFVLSIAALAMLQASSHLGTISGQAVATAPPVEHATPVASTVLEVHVQPGQLVAAGTPLVTLSSTAIQGELTVVRAEIAALERAAEHAQIQLEFEHAEAQRALEQTVAEAARDDALASSAATRERAVARAAEKELETLEARVEQRIESSGVLPDATYRAEADDAAADDARRAARAEAARRGALAETLETWPDDHALSAATARLDAARLEVLRAREANLTRALEGAVIVARRDGIVTQVAATGAPADPGISLATLVPAAATEIVAWVDPSVSPEQIVAGAEAHITAPVGVCGGRPGRVLRYGAVGEAPGQIRSVLDNPVHGLPVYLSVPEGCALTVGQVLQVEIPR